jgi:hypothetical protein
MEGHPNSRVEGWPGLRGRSARASYVNGGSSGERTGSEGPSCRSRRSGPPAHRSIASPTSFSSICSQLASSNIPAVAFERGRITKAHELANYVLDRKKSCLGIDREKTDTCPHYSPILWFVCSVSMLGRSLNSIFKSFMLGGGGTRCTCRPVTDLVVGHFFVTIIPPLVQSFLTLVSGEGLTFFPSACFRRCGG